MTTLRPGIFLTPVLGLAPPVPMLNPPAIPGGGGDIEGVGAANPGNVELVGAAGVLPKAKVDVCVPGVAPAG